MLWRLAANAWSERHPVGSGAPLPGRPQRKPCLSDETSPQVEAVPQTYAGEGSMQSRTREGLGSRC